MVTSVFHAESANTSVMAMSEAAFATIRAQEGDAVVLRQGCHWRACYPGFYQPIHLLARIRAAEVKQPTRLCWGFRAALTEEDAHLANGSVPLHLLTDVQSFSESALSRNRRSDLRRCARQVEFRQLQSPDLLLEQGYEVFMSAVRRLGHWRPVTELEYRNRVSRRAGHGRRLFIAGLIDGKLRGYLDSYAIDGVLYTDQIFIASDALRTGIGTGLYVATILAAARDRSIVTVCNSLHRPEDPDLCRFKAGLGFRVVQVPARTVIPAPIRAYLRARRPATYYRLTGDGTALAANGASPAVDLAADCAG